MCGSPFASLCRSEDLAGDFADFELALGVFGLTGNPGDGIRQTPHGLCGASRKKTRQPQRPEARSIDILCLFC